MKQSIWYPIGLVVWCFVMAIAACHLAYPEDLRLSPDGTNIQSVATITNTFTKEFLASAEKSALDQITKEYEAIQKAQLAIQSANQNIEALNARLTDIRRYQVTLDAMLKMKRDGTNVVSVPITLPAAKPGASGSPVTSQTQAIPADQDIDFIG